MLGFLSEGRTKHERGLTKKLPKTDSEKLNEILTRVNGIDSRVNGIDSRLQELEHTVAAKLHDTRPIWHKVIADIAQLQTGQDAISEKICKLHSTVRDVNRDQIVINDSLRKIQLDFRDIDERLYRLELNQRNSST